MPMPERFVFVCVNQRPPEHPRPSCLANGSAEVFEALREEQGRRLLTSVKIVAGGCLEACMVGPVMVVFPDNVWYGGVTEQDVPAIMDHLEGGPPVEFLRIGEAEFDLRPPGGVGGIDPPRPSGGVGGIDPPHPPGMLGGT